MEYRIQEVKMILPNPRWFIPAVIVMAILMAFAFAHAEVIDLNAIMIIESNGKANAIGKDGEIGLFQIMPCVLKEYNLKNGSNLGRNALFRPEINKKVSTWYLTKRIPQMLNYYKKPVNNENIIWCYNAGIGNLIKGIKPNETKNYIKKYLKLTRRSL